MEKRDGRRGPRGVHKETKRWLGRLRVFVGESMVGEGDVGEE